MTYPQNLPKNINLVMDSRKVQKSDFFLALDGEKFKGIDFIEDVVNKGAAGIIFGDNAYNQAKASLYKDKLTLVSVADPYLFLGEFSSRHRQDWAKHKNPDYAKHVIGIAGSNGKTTHKYMLAHLLTAVFGDRCISTEKNYNNHVGVPQTLLRIKSDTIVAVVEMGTNHPGELPYLCKIVKADAGILTNIGHEHLEFFKNLDNVFIEESSLYHSIVADTNGLGVQIINVDDPYLASLPLSAGTITYGQNKGSIRYHYKHDFIRFDKTEIRNSFITGEHNFKNLLACFLMARELYPQHERAFLSACSTFKPLNNRSEWVTLQKKNIFLDAYNANPSSMRAAVVGFLETLSKQDDAYFILGDMNELGDEAPVLHREIGEFLREKGIKNVAFIGRYAHDYSKGFQDTCLLASSKADFLRENWGELWPKYSRFFIKGSRSLELETLLNPLKA